MQLYRKSKHFRSPCVNTNKQNPKQERITSFIIEMLYCLGREIEFGSHRCEIAAKLQDTCLLGFIFQIAILIKRLILPS